MAAAFIIGLANTRQNIKGYGLDVEKIDNLLLKLTVVLFIGARVGVVLLNLDYYLANPSHIFIRAGLGSHGAIIAVMILGYFWTRKTHLSYWQIADAIAPTLSIGHIFIRLGNFINGELYGAATNLPWGVVFPTSGVPVHPIQLYELFSSLIILPFAIKWAKNPQYHGYAFFRVMLAHSIIRFFLDFLRYPTDTIGPLAFTQIIALGFTLLFTAKILQEKFKA